MPDDRTPRSPAAPDGVGRGIVQRPGVVVLLGATDSGKTTLARRLLAAGIGNGLRCALLDTDLGQSSVGPPTTLGLRGVTSEEDLEDVARTGRADVLAFVGHITPPGHLLPLVAGFARLIDLARRRAELVVVDTSGFVAGPVAQRLKLHKLELARPRHVVGLRHGAQLDPLLAIAGRVGAEQVSALPVTAEVSRKSPSDRARARRRRLEAALAGPQQRTQIPPDAALPPLPPDLDPAALEGLLVGLDDAVGTCLGLGVLSAERGRLAVSSPVARRPAAVRLGGMRVREGWNLESVNLAHLLRGR